MRIRTLSFAVVATAVIACSNRYANVPPHVDAGAHAEIEAMMSRSAAAWTRGDLDAFMRDYLPGERTTYVTSRGLVRGPEQIRARYAPRFAPGALHDSLSFEGIEVDPLAPGVAHVVAWYVLTRADSLVARGPTSLVMLRTEDGWKIVHDHSS